MRGLNWLLAAALLTATCAFASPAARADEPAVDNAISALKAKDALLTAKLKKIAKETDTASACFFRRGCGWGGCGWGGCGWGGCGWGWGCRSYCYAPCYSYNYCYTPVCYTAPVVAYRPAYYPTVSYYAPASFVSYGGYGGCFYW